MLRMTNRLRYHEVHSPQSWNPLAAAMRLCHGMPFGEFMLYERDGAWHYAGGTVAQLSVKPKEIRVSWPGRKTTAGWEDNPLPAISALLSDYPGDRWNAFGWTTFELSYYLHGLGSLSPEPELPLVRLMIPHTEAVIGPAGVVVRSLSRTTAAECVELLEDAGHAVARSPRPVPVDSGRAEYCAAVETAVADIRDGLLDKVIVSRRVPIGAAVDMAATYRAGREANTPARSFLLRLDGFEAAGFCPETVAEVGHDGHVTTQPLAGTRALGRGVTGDLALRNELCSDPKEVYEHAISMRTSWEELGTVCERGSVRVDVPMEVKLRGTVQHLGSVVSGQLAAGRTSLDGLAALYPAVTASGIPKAAACSLISRLEPAARGLDAGSVLRMDHAGGLDAALVLRSAYQAAGQAWLQAGAGIVKASRPEREFTETCEKLASVAGHIVPAAGTSTAGTSTAGTSTAGTSTAGTSAVARAGAVAAGRESGLTSPALPGSPVTPALPGA
jgi:salicylate synthase